MKARVAFSCVCVLIVCDVSEKVLLSFAQPPRSSCKKKGLVRTATFKQNAQAGNLQSVLLAITWAKSGKAFALMDARTS